MYSIAVDATFSAVHRVQLPNRAVEPLHGHDWGVRAWFAQPELGESGMVVDFSAARATLEGILADLQAKNLNEIDPLSRQNPTAEVLAKYLFERIRAAGVTSVCRVEVKEAPGCLAAYEAPSSAAGAARGPD